MWTAFWATKAPVPEAAPKTAPEPEALVAFYAEGPTPTEFTSLMLETHEGADYFATRKAVAALLGEPLGNEESVGVKRLGPTGLTQWYRLQRRDPEAVILTGYRDGCFVSPRPGELHGAQVEWRPPAEEPGFLPPQPVMVASEPTKRARRSRKRE